MNSALFRASVGPLAFSTFTRRGRLSHDTHEPIPGVLTKGDYRRAHLMHLADHAREIVGG